mmetsp:Transcript_7894/g.13430  ORF Transcript_7894/g.13430 Transcript_7894/m.13430 type:complete len:209 (+) Transcript_7894:341-967(+)
MTLVRLFWHGLRHQSCQGKKVKGRGTAPQNIAVPPQEKAATAQHSAAVGPPTLPEVVAASGRGMATKDQGYLPPQRHRQQPALAVRRSARTRRKTWSTRKRTPWTQPRRPLAVATRRRRTGSPSTCPRRAWRASAPRRRPWPRRGTGGGRTWASGRRRSAPSGTAWRSRRPSGPSSRSGWRPRGRPSRRAPWSWRSTSWPACGCCGAR